jgi:hypothetical protein
MREHVFAVPNRDLGERERGQASERVRAGSAAGSPATQG